MSIPSKFDPFFPIRRTGSSDNERAQLNKLLRLIIGELGISQDTSFEEAIAELEKKLEAVESGDTASVIWGHVFGSIENQEDLWDELESKIENLGEVDSFQADVIASRPAAGNAGTWFLAKDERKIYYDDGDAWQLLLSIDHADLENVGTNTHAQIDDHIADTSIHFSDLSGFDTDDLSEGTTNLYHKNTSWGDILGTLSDQTDLQNALDSKASSSHTHDLSDLNQSGATDGQIVKWDNTLGEWVPDDESAGGVSAFTGLTDTPSDYTGTTAEASVPRVNATTDGLEWVDLGTVAYADLGTGASQVPTNDDLNISNWDTAFSWGDHAGLYGELSGTNEWAGINRFGPDGIEIYNSGIGAEHTKLRSVATTSPKTITFPNASGTVSLVGHTHAAGDITSGTFANARIAQSNVTQHQAALSITESQISDLSHLTPGGTANQIQTNDGSGGLAGIPVSYASGRLTELPINSGATFDVKRSDGSSSGIHQFKVEASQLSSSTMWYRFGRDTNTTGNVLITFHNHDGGAGQWWEISKASGMVFGAPSGGLPGAGKINAEGVQVDGVNVLKVGDFGLGSVPSSFNDLNNAGNTTQFFTANSGAANSPFAGVGVGLNIARQTGRNIQLLGQSAGSDPILYYREQGAGSTWSAWVEMWHSGNLEVDSDTVTLGGDFDSGQQVKCVRVGDQVTITLLGALSHANSSNVFSGNAIPSKYRPQNDQVTTYFVSRSLDVSATVSVSTGGLLEFGYEQVSTSSSSSQINTIVATSITYNV